MTSLNKIASTNILTFLDEGRLVQSTWSTEREGKHMACLLGAAGGYKSTSECPAELMPRWLADCTVTLFDNLAPTAVPPIARRYGQLIARWSVLIPDAWSAVLSRWLVRLIDQAVEAVPAFAKTQPYWAAVEGACAQSKAAILSGDKAAANVAANVAYAATYVAANAAARLAANTAAAAANVAARLAANVAAAAANVAADPARLAAYAANNVAAIVAYAAYAATYVAANAAARLAANTAIFNSLLDEIEGEINRACTLNVIEDCTK